MQQRFLLQILLLAQHVSGNTMPIIRSSRVLYSGCFLWYFVLWFSSCWSGVELRVMCPVCRMLQHPANVNKCNFVKKKSSSDVKDKAVPLQSWRVPEGYRKLRFPDFMTPAQDGGQVVSLTHRPPLPQGNTPGTHFC